MFAQVALDKDGFTLREIKAGSLLCDFHGGRLYTSNENMIADLVLLTIGLLR